MKELFHGELNVYFSKNIEEAFQILNPQDVAILLIKIKSHHLSDWKILHELKKESPNTLFYAVSNHFTDSDLTTGKKIGISAFINEPLNLEELRQLFLHEINLQSFTMPSNISNKLTENKIIAESKEMMLIWELVQKVAKTDANVLITGETGTGKEVIARAIYNESERALKPFVPVNCAAIPDNLLESEMFGYEEGAFTGANRKKIGRFELANSGTILLDEVGDTSLGTQAKLLRILEERVVERLGGTKSIPINIRVISSTNKDLTEQIACGNFREDLYYRLAVFPIYIPPLRERKKDIPALLNHFLNVYIEKYHRTDIVGFDKILIEALLFYSWPGNVRELRNTVEQLVILSEGPYIEYNELLMTLNIGKGDFTPVPLRGIHLKDEMDSFERQVLISCLKACSGNRTKAAENLGISRRTLQLKIKKHQLC